MNTTAITVYFSTIDRYNERRTFKTLAGAQKYARCKLGENADVGSTYAVGMYGDTKIECSGCTIAELFQKTSKEPENYGQCAMNRDCQNKATVFGWKAHEFDGWINSSWDEYICASCAAKRDAEAAKYRAETEAERARAMERMGKNPCPF